MSVVRPDPFPPRTAEGDARRPPWPALILVVFGVTILWALRFALAYLLVPTACLVGDWPLHLVGGIAILAAVGVLALNVRWLRRDLDVPVRFLLAVGVALNGFFLAVTALESSATFLVDACAKGAIP